MSCRRPSRGRPSQRKQCAKPGAVRVLLHRRDPPPVRTGKPRAHHACNTATFDSSFFLNLDSLNAREVPMQGAKIPWNAGPLEAFVDVPTQLCRATAEAW